MTEVQQKLIDAVLKKMRQKCPDAVDLIGVYGSACTGDTHAKSDLDLLILINDAKAYTLADCFILQDEGIGYDTYCTTWQMLEGDAQCNHAHLSKLMDSKIVYVRNQNVTERLDELKKQAADLLASDRRFEKAAEIKDQLCKQYAYAQTADSFGKQRTFAAYIIALALDSVMIYNGKYFKKGTKRTFEELEGLNQPENFRRNIGQIVSARNSAELGTDLTDLVRAQIKFIDSEISAKDKAAPSKENISGTYEEMFSNWKNKMTDAAERGDAFSSFMNLAFFQFMLEEISTEVDIPKFNVLENYAPDNLKGNAKIFDEALERYLQEYRKAGIKPNSYANVDEYLKSYLES